MNRRRHFKTLAALTSVCFLLVLSVVADRLVALTVPALPVQVAHPPNRSEEHTSELQSQR